jgi:excisionase family DNA binding protein
MDIRAPLTLKETARALGLSVHTVRAWISQRRLNHVRLGRAIRVLPDEIETILKNAAVPALETLNGKQPLSELGEPVHEKDATAGRLPRQIEGR